MNNRILLFFLFALCISQTSCQNYKKLKVISSMPSSLNENSGIQSFDQESIWTIEDSGNKDVLYKVNIKGVITNQFKVKNAKNNDWEDLTSDTNGNLYIGDFGNNSNDRKNLVIYKLPNPEKENGDKINAAKISFSYAEQKKFPPKKKELLYDAEAFFHHAGYLYIFTKNRTNPFTGKTLIYRVPDKEGDYKAKLMGEITLCNDWDTCRITSAAISPNGKSIVLLSYGKLWVISNFKIDAIPKGTIKEIDLGIRTQLESVCYKDNSTLFLSDEKTGHKGGNLYEYTLK